MKLLILALIAMTSITSVFACSPARYPYIHQKSELAYLLDSAKFSDEMIRLGGERISSITMLDGLYNVTLSSGCFLKAKVIYKSPSSIGMCATMVDVNLVSGCN